MTKSQFIKVRVTEQEKAAFDAVAASRGKTMSEILRATMTRAIGKQAKASTDEGQ